MPNMFFISISLSETTFICVDGSAAYSSRPSVFKMNSIALCLMLSSAELRFYNSLSSANDTISFLASANSGLSSEWMLT